MILANKVQQEAGSKHHQLNIIWTSFAMLKADFIEQEYNVLLHKSAAAQRTGCQNKFSFFPVSCFFF